MKYENRVYVIENVLRTDTYMRLLSYIQKCFERQGTSKLYFSAIYEKFENDFVTDNMYSEEMLKQYLDYVVGEKYVIKSNYILCSDEENVQDDVSDAIRAVMMKEARIIKKEELQMKLSYIPKNKISYTLSINPEFINAKRGGFYFHVSLVTFDNHDLGVVRNIIRGEIEESGYMSGRKLLHLIKNEHDDIWEKGIHVTELGLRNAIAYNLRKEFAFNSNIISDIDKEIDNKMIFQMFGKKHKKFTLNDLEELRNDLGSGCIYFDDVYVSSVRVNENEFVSKGLLHFDINEVDEAISKFCYSNYVPINEIKAWGLFPYVGTSWNNYLLEGLVHSYSEKYKILHTGFNGTGTTGVIIKKASGIDDYQNIIINALVNSDVSLLEEEAYDYLYDNGYIAKRRISGFDIMLTRAKKLREELR